MDGASDAAFGATRQPNGTAATQTPHSDAVANILAASPDWRIQAGPSPAATAGEVRGQAAAQAADAGQFVGQAASPALAIHHQGQAAAIANQSRSRSRSFATVEETQNQLSHGHPSPARPLPPIPTIVITTPDQRTHAPDSPTLHRGRQPAHRRLRRHELQNRVAELEQRIREMTDEAEAQEMVSEALWGEVAGLRARIREWEGVGERRVGEIERLGERVRYLEGELGRERGLREGWRGRAGVAEGVLRMLEGWGADDGEVEGELFMDCE